jgi:predicted ATPase
MTPMGVYWTGAIVAQEKMPMLSMTLLGEAVIAQDGLALNRFRSQKEAALLIYLAHTGQTHNREALADLLWDARSTKQSLANLRTVLTRLRAQVGDALVATRKTLAYAEAWREQIDSVRFQRELAALPVCRSLDDAQRLQAAVNLFAGDFLRGFYVTDAPRFNEWVVVEQELLRRQAIAGYQALIDYAATSGEYAFGIEAALRWLALDNLNEPLHARLMELLAAAGQRGAALARYTQLADLLEIELGVEPRPGTTRLYRRILHGADPATAAHAAPELHLHGAPRQTNLFVGREAELAMLDEWLSDRTKRLVTVIGPGGIGKTSLALEAVRCSTQGASARGPRAGMAAHFPDGIYFVPLDEIGDVAALVGAIAGVVGYRFRSGAGEEMDQLLTHLIDKALLLILDNFEQLEERAALAVQELVAGAPAVHLLITSRHSLEAPGEAVLSLAGLEAPGDEANALHASGVQLFLQSARRIRPTFDLHVDDLPHLARLCNLLDGLPLAIILAASWVTMLSPAEIVAEIERDAALLAVDTPDRPPRQQSIQATFDHSWALLTEAEQTILARLAILRNGYPLAVARAIGGATLPQLRALVRQSLLQRDLEQERFAMHELLRRFAVEKLSGLGLSLPGLHHRARAILETLEENDSVSRYDKLAHHANMAGEAAKARRYLGLLGEAALADHQYARAADSFGQASALAPATGPAEQFPLLLGREEALHWLGRREEQLITLAALEDLAMQLEDRTQLATAKLRAARLAEATGDHAASRQAAREAAALAEAAGDGELIARSSLAWGIALGRQGEYEPAKRQLNQAIAMARTAGIPAVESAGLRNLGTDAAYQGDFADARAYFEADLQLVRRTGDRTGERQALGNLGVIARYLGDLSGAQGYLEEALPLFRQIGDRRGEVIARSNLGVIAHHQGNLPSAGIHYRKALAISRQIGDRQSESEALIHLGGLYLDQGESGRAAAHYEAARAIALRCNLPAYVIEAQTGMAAAMLASGDLPLALALVQEYLDDVAGDGLDAAEDPLRVYLNCYRVLRAGRDARAGALIATAATLLREQAARIADRDARQAFQTHIPVHREILAAA